ncbi:hypothetical protein LEP1GSC058_0818 [Leptospira fainei serovar Hurstbridge str. BUT 6]|uniref:Uncharacterized protein n=1 Tax=Leptospira fainei serovar Hurstbridge str. BUT 6 TaxID=1193011 RepID=S3V2V6_9LEPT|nr:hypothetical protein LEP1GSC058_0818 [Leptospira fainei serovar Hurstbridge str. BUT 6]
MHRLPLPFYPRLSPERISNQTIKRRIYLYPSQWEEISIRIF